MKKAGPFMIRRGGLAVLLGAGLLLPGLLWAAPVPGGSLDPLTIPKYVTPLVIPPVMPDAGTAGGGPATPNSYDIAQRQFQQQILPAGYPATTVWSYGAAADPVPALAPSAASSFNYPAFTFETLANPGNDPGGAVSVRWRNELVAINPANGMPWPEGNPNRTFLPHLFPVDQTLHWANPASATPCVDGSPGTDCRTLEPTPYTGPVPMVVHVHGAHVDDHSDGYPEAWWLPEAANLAGYTESGSVFMDVNSGGVTPNAATPGYVDYRYRNDQPATTLWYHDHSLGITRLNVYAGPAGFWLVRGGPNDTVDDASTPGVPDDGVLPGPAPVSGQGIVALNTPGNAVRNGVREIPVVIQDRSFNADGSLFYPASRAFFDGFTGPYIDGTQISDISPLWNPEAFFNTMVVNGVTWPVMEVAQAKYRFRLLNGCNSRFLNLALFQITPQGGGKKNKDKFKMGAEVPFFQIGAEQGFLPAVVEVRTGSYITYDPVQGAIPTAAPDPMQALLLGPAERADVIVDFGALPSGTIVRMINTAPDAPFGGFPDVPADPWTTGQVMQFVVNSALSGASDTDPTGATPATAPQNLALNAENALNPNNDAATRRTLSLNEMASDQVCVRVNPAGIIQVLFSYAVTDPNYANFLADCTAARGVPMAPREALLGTYDPSGAVGGATPLMWVAPITENPQVGDQEVWEIFNLTMDGHPIHLHLVRFEVFERELLDPLTFLPTGVQVGTQPYEAGYKDTVIALPGQVTRIRAVFDVEGLYVWHCHILEHEDNEMMRPYYVGDLANSPVP